MEGRGGGAFKRGVKALTHGRGSVDICEIIILSIFCLKLSGGGWWGRELKNPASPAPASSLD